MMDSGNKSEPITAIDVVFVIEGTAINGAYISELKANYLIPTLEFLSHGQLEDRDFGGMDRCATQYAVVIYTTACSLLEPSCRTFGPYTSAQKVIECFERLPLFGGGLESCTNLSEGLAVAHDCFDSLHESRQLKMPPSQYTKDCPFIMQKFCIVICNSPPYNHPVLESRKYSGKTGKHFHHSTRNSIALLL